MKTNNKLLKGFLQNILADEKSQNTADAYECDLKGFINYISKEYHNNSITLDDADKTFFQNITLEQLNDYKNRLFEDGKSPNTRSRTVSALKQFFKYLHKTAKVITENPTEELTKVKIPSRNPVILNKNEAEKFLNSVTGEYKVRDSAILTLFIHCGLRLSELIGINLNHIKGDVLTVIGKGNKQRDIYLNDSCMNVITEYLKVRTEIEGEKALFLSEKNQRISKSRVEKLVKKYIGISGLDTKKYSVHKLRGTSASLMGKSGVPIQVIQKVLGHTNINTTTIYVNVDEESMREATRINPLNKISR
ncbi:MAG: tyrosine-type recombinase/integrase [Tissierellia bacterium]|nr:tyrosine-type recombinase/integrase [Tissierellia bacterium]